MPAQDIPPVLESAILSHALALEEECERVKVVFYRPNGTLIQVVDMEVTDAAIPVPEYADALP